MRYMKDRMHFNKDEFMRLEMHNPTLFELAEYVADKAHIIVENNSNKWVSVYQKTEYGKGQLLCPFEVFYTKDTDLMRGDPKCSELTCWSMQGETYPTDDGVKVIRPCWLRTWNEFVKDQKAETKEEED